jgi:hypothetical protein
MIDKALEQYAAAPHPFSPEEFEDLIRPAFQEKVHEHLAAEETTAATGWRDVFWRNTKQHHEQVGDPD